MTIRNNGALYHVGVAQFDGASWKALGSPLIQAGSAADYAMTIGANGLPIVADSEYVSSEVGDRLFTYEWTGTSWGMPGPAGTAGDYLDQPALAVAPDGRLVVAWIDRTKASVNSIVTARLEP